MSAVPARDDRAAAPPMINIGQLLAKLKPDFPDLTPSKVRFLEEERLLSPARTHSGYRKFGAADLDRLRLILTLQRDHYLPLKVIRGYLSDLDAGNSPVWPGRVEADEPSMLDEGRRYTRDELLAASGAASALLDDAIGSSLLPAAELHSEESLAVLRSLVELGRHGIEPRHLRGFRSSAEREAGLLGSAVQTVLHRKDSGSRARGVELAQDLAAQLDVVRASLIRAELAKLAG